MLDGLYQELIGMVPMSVVAVIGAVFLWGVNLLLQRRARALVGEGTFRRQLAMTVLVTMVFVAILIAAPFKDETRGDLITLFGVALTGVIALSSTTLASNAMAGLMLGIVRNFKRGDYIRSTKIFGRVTERGLFHTEIQNERSDLTTVPNLFLVTNPVTVIRPSGTFVATEVSLGYDLPHVEVERLLVEAAADVGLEEAFTRILSLGDFAVTYQVAGRLSETKKYLGSKTALHRAVLNSLHANHMEIVSPTFMNQRQLGENRSFVPPVDGSDGKPADTERAPDTVVFDKADRVERSEELKERVATLDDELIKLEEIQKKASAEEAESLQQTIDARRRHRERLVARLEQVEAADD